MKRLDTSSIKVLVRGGGDLASGVAWRLHQSGFKVLITEMDRPMAVRRTVSFCEAVYDGQTEVEGVLADLIQDVGTAHDIWAQGRIPVLVDPEAHAKSVIKPDVMVDAILAKKNLGTACNDAPLVIALGPGFVAGKDAHFVVETRRGHQLGRLLTEGAAEPDTGVPGPVQGVTTDRVLRAPADGQWQAFAHIGDMVRRGDQVGAVAQKPVHALIDGLLRGLIRPGVPVSKGLKIGDIDPRGIKAFCYTISDKALAVGGGVLEGILRYYKRSRPSRKSGSHSRQNS
jgi:xanthine dehydrogenase accessory factor